MDKEVIIQEYHRRVDLVQTLMKEIGLDAVLFSSTAQQGTQLCVKFFSNYMLNTRRAYIFCALGGEPYLIVPTVGQQFHAQKISWLPENHVVTGNMMSIIKEFLAGHKVVGWYQPEELPSSVYRELTSLDVCYVDISRELTEARANKSQYEIELTQSASQLAAESFREVLKILRPGVTEEDLIGAAEGYLRAHGASDSLVLTRSQRPHSIISRAQPVPIARDGLFLYSAEVAGRGGYWTQMVRPVFMSRDAQPEAQAILRVSKAAEAAGVAILRPGYRVSDVCMAIEDVVIQSGLKTGVWCGHGMGPDLGDAVDIGSSNQMKIVPNMVITLHPSIVSETDGLLYGNTFLTTEGAPINLTDYYNASPFLEDLLKEI